MKASLSGAKPRFNLERGLPILLLLPSLVAIGVFVYGFIGWTGYVSLSQWNTFVRDLSFAGLDNYRILFSDFRFRADLRNTVVFTVVFTATCLVIGMLLACLLDQRPRGEAFFRNLFLFPMSLSFVVTGVVWQWLLNPSTGVNLLLKKLGMSALPLWYVDTRVLPGGWSWGQVPLGVPVALLAVVLAAVWQMSGFSMAIFLAALQGIPEEVREAAHIDGATGWKLYRHVLLPLLWPAAFTVTIVLGHVSLKVFDLVYAMTGSGAAYVTDMPSVYMFETTFRGNRFAQGAAISMIMLLMTMAIFVPYLLWRERQGEKSG